MSIRAHASATVLLDSYSYNCVYATVDDYCPESKGQKCRLEELWCSRLQKYNFLRVVLQQYVWVWHVAIYRYIAIFIAMVIDTVNCCTVTALLV